MKQTRREFLKSCACAGALGALALSGVGCSDGNNADGGGDGDSDCPFTLDNDGNVVLNLDECSHLTEDNAAIYLSGTPIGGMLVTHTTGDDFHALSAICTHEHCLVQATTPQLICPCHGSRYNLTGTVVTGPATSSLHAFQIARTGNTLVISV